ncbi:MAG: T9SS type A sorting domain-containing protein [Bacteroidota bacterium]
MQQVKQLLIILTLVLGFGLSVQAQCDPDTMTSEVPGLYPDTLVDGKVGVMYNQVITLVIPQDSAVDTGPPFGSIEIDICSLVLDSIPNLPQGMSFSCNTPDCVFTVNHDSGFVNRACVILEGMPFDTIATDTLNVYVTINPGAYDAAQDTCLPLGIPLPPALTTILYRTPFEIEPDSTFVNSIDEYALADFNLKLFPNPTQGKTHLRYSLPERVDNVEIQMTDLFGRQVQSLKYGPQSAGDYEVEVGERDLSAGIYLVSINLNDGAKRLTRKLIVE